MADFLLKQGDLEPPVQITLVDAAGVAVDVSEALTIKFKLAPVFTRAALFERNAVVDDAEAGQLSYIWQSGDTTTPGVYYGEFVIRWPGARDQTLPTSGYLTIAIEPHLV